MHESKRKGVEMKNTEIDCESGEKKNMIVKKKKKPFSASSSTPKIRGRRYTIQPIVVSWSKVFSLRRGEKKRRKEGKKKGEGGSSAFARRKLCSSTTIAYRRKKERRRRGKPRILGVYSYRSVAGRESKGQKGNPIRRRGMYFHTRDYNEKGEGGNDLRFSHP